MSFDFHLGSAPLLISIPHAGTEIPDALCARMTDEALVLPDTDWYVDTLYDFAPALGASVLKANMSRYVIDLNRPADDEELYPGQVKTGLCPQQSFDGTPLYKDGCEPDEAEIKERTEQFWRPYHAQIGSELSRLRAQHGFAILYDAHSIRSHVPRLFEGRLQDLNIGTFGGQSCGETIAQAALKAAQNSSYSVVLNGRFQGGTITRHYGDPANNIHALQMEMVQENYMDEESPYAYDPAKAEQLKGVLEAVIKAVLKGA